LKLRLHGGVIAELLHVIKLNYLIILQARLRDGPTRSDVEDNIKNVKAMIEEDTRFKSFSPALLKRRALTSAAHMIISTGEGETKQEKKCIRALRKKFKEQVLNHDFLDASNKSEL
jgi:hypothetical protein